MAGVGIFFQQEPTTGRVYVANIVERGSADRSGVIRVNDVIVKIDDEDVQGQPLSTLRNLILGKQGTYVVLAFRRCLFPRRTDFYRGCVMWWVSDAFHHRSRQLAH